MEKEVTSFDPKTWLAPGPLSDGAPPVPPDDPPPSSRRARWPLFVAVAVAAVAVLAWTLWPQAAEPPSGAAARPETQAAPVAAAASDVALRIIEVESLDDLGLSLEAMGVPVGDAFVLAEETIATLGSEEAMRISVELGGTGQTRTVRMLTAELDNGTLARLTRKADGSYARERVLESATTRTQVASGELRHNTFYASAVEAGIPDSLITPFAKAMSFDFDFQLEVKQGDKFTAAWEETVTPGGRQMSAPQLVYVKLQTGKGTREYFAFTPPDEIEPRWFARDGSGNTRSLMRTPVDGARITSKFGYRIHPIYQTRKQHGGVDFAAPTGTPVYASGDATVIFRAAAGGAGNLIRLEHEGGMQTYYMHLSRFADGLEVGQTVRQGTIIGYVGTTGASTGPHLHYEIRIDGEKMDPLTFETTKVEPLRGEALTMFMARRDRTGQSLEKGS